MSGKMSVEKEKIIKMEEKCERCEDKISLIWELALLMDKMDNVIEWYKKMLNKRLKKLEEENKK